MTRAKTVNLSSRTLMAAMLLVMALNVQGETVLSPYTATYQANFNGIPVVITQKLEAMPAGYRIGTSAANALGEIHEQEDFHLADGAILVDEYRHERSLLGSKRKEKLSVDRVQGVAHYLRDGDPRDIPLEPGYLGPISYQMQLRRDLAAGNSTFHYRVMHRGKVKDYYFERDGADTIQTATGAIDTIRVHRVRDDNERTTIFWMAPTLGYQLVKLRQEEDGDRYELLLTRLSPSGIAVAKSVPATR
jgi:hypothetical protein